MVGTITRTDLSVAQADWTRATLVAATSVAPNVESSSPPDPAYYGEPSIDDEWPIDEKGDGCTAPVWPAAALDAPRVLIIGDSLIRNARDLLEADLTEAGWVPTVRCWGAKGTDWGAGQVQRASELGQLPDTVVVSLGTNDIWWLGIPMDVAVDQMMAALGPDRTVYWVNLWHDPSAYDDLPKPGPANEVLSQKAQQYAHLYVVDFARAFQDAEASGNDVGWVDGVHLNETANHLREALIVSAVTSGPPTS